MEARGGEAVERWEDEMTWKTLGREFTSSEKQALKELNHIKPGFRVAYKEESPGFINGDLWVSKRDHLLNRDRLPRLLKWKEDYAK